MSSLIAVEGARLMPEARAPLLLKLSRWLVLTLAVPVVLVAAQGYSVLYLFLFADLLCAAAAFPVFFGMYSKRHDGFDALLATLGGQAAGLAMLPLPGQPLDTLLESFLLAALVPAAITLMLRRVRKDREPFDLTTLDASVRRFGREEAGAARGQ